MWILFLVALGGGYGIAHAFGASEGWSAGSGWGLAVLVFLIGRRRGYRAAIRVERWREEAMSLGRNDPETYERILAQADSEPEAAAAAARDPDAYVALFMAAANDAPPGNLEWDAGSNGKPDAPPTSLDGMPSLGSEERCPACGSDQVVEDDRVCVCKDCAAVGARFRGAMIYVGIHGNPRRGEARLNDAVQPPVLMQLAAVAPTLGNAASDPSVAQAFNYGALNIIHHFQGTSFDIEDDDVNAAIATFASNVLGPSVRRDDNRFHLTTAASDWGWWWRYFEREDEVAPQDPAGWLKKLIPSGWEMSRSERLGNAAQNYAMEDDLPDTTIGFADHGEDVILASFLLFCATMDVDALASQVGVDLTTLERAHRFGLAIRTVVLADALGFRNGLAAPRREPS